ncbi:TauD/TfdA family dioxygenase [Gammaproteobacteria bacterium]|nr:TauD/TfdA family dioxygenase [Gammaproteobacteria bacterium]
MKDSILLPEDWVITKLGGSLGAELQGPSIKNITKKEVKLIKELLAENMVLFLPDQSPTIEEHVAFGEHFGKLEGHPNLTNPNIKHPKIFELAASKGGVADEWHTDMTFLKSPPLMSILHMVECPEVGGDTMWTNLCKAFESLSEPVQDLCMSLSALHDAAPHFRPEQMTIHPVVRKHPDGKGPVLYVNEHFTRRIVEMSIEESDLFLNFLTQWVKKSDFTVRHKWTKGTIAIWDNRCTQHFVLNDFVGERIIQRVTVMGDKIEPCKKNTYNPWTRNGRYTARSRYDFPLMNFLKEENDN